MLSGIILLGGGAVLGSDADSTFAATNQSYQDMDYESALNGYLSLEKEGYQSASLYYNIGNCYFKMGELGYAILYYLRAKRLDPVDDDINANLAFARQFMPTRLEGVEINPVTEFMGTVTEPLTMNEAAWIWSALFIVFFLFISAAIYFRLSGLAAKVTGYCLFALLIAASGATAYKYRNEYLTKRAVIVSDETNIYSAPSDESDLEFVGAFGLTVEIDKSADKYFLVIFENKRRGWIKKDDVRII
jgi:tetratricopeptide (TPR) repeat protein